MQRRKAIFNGLLASLGIAGLAFAASGARSEGGPPVGVRKRKRPNEIPNVEVIDQHGQKLRFYDDLIKDKVVMINAFYAECGGSCPLVTENLKIVYDMFGGRVGRDIDMYTFSLQPERDTPELLKQYTEVHGTGPGWRFLTGKREDIELLRTCLGFTDPDPELDILADSHTGILRYGNDKLRRWAGCPAAGRPAGIYATVTKSVMDAGAGGPSVPPRAPNAPAHDHHHHSKI